MILEWLSCIFSSLFLFLLTKLKIFGNIADVLTKLNSSKLDWIPWQKEKKRKKYSDLLQTKK